MRRLSLVNRKVEGIWIADLLGPHIRGGQTAPPIKMDENSIVDRNRRYVAGVLTGKLPATTPETASPSQVRNAKPFGEIKVGSKYRRNH